MVKRSGKANEDKKVRVWEVCAGWEREAGFQKRKAVSAASKLVVGTANYVWAEVEVALKSTASKNTGLKATLRKLSRNKTSQQRKSEDSLVHMNPY